MNPSQSNSVFKNRRRFSLLDLKLASDDFNKEFLIGTGGFGRVYRGTIDNGTTAVAIKRLKLESGQGGSEFWTEIKMLSELRHEHLVSLIGYCNEGQEMIVVYEYMSQGTLEDHLYGKIAVTGTSPLSWELRLKICIGAACGLHFLHTNHRKVIHRDVKSSNILLDANWLAKISDFGLSKMGPEGETDTHVSTNVKGSFGYLDPEYFTTGKLTFKTDVYAFGVVLFEVLCGRAAVDKSREEDEQSLANWACKCIKRGKVGQIIDSSLKGEILPACLKAYVRIATKCLDKDRNTRPDMAEIVTVLNSALALQLNKVPSSSSVWSLRSWWTDPFQRADKLPSMDSDSPLQPQEATARKAAMPIQRKYSTFQHLNVQDFSFKELKNATRNFHPDGLLGEGGFGNVFKGWINEHTLTASKPGYGKAIAVKMLKPESLQAHKEWLTEIHYLGGFHHPNLIKLIGYCSNGDKRLLVREFMPNGSLADYLFLRAQSLCWETRIKVAIGAARGLSFLHDAEPQFICRKFSSSIILLDEDFTAKLSGFSFAKDEPTDQNAHEIVAICGYVAPEYGATGQLSAKSDVYCFGVVLLELLSGRCPLDRKRVGLEQYLVKWAKSCFGERNFFKIIDTKIEGQYPQEAAFTATKIALQCLSSNPKKRPLMWKVVARLEQL